MDLREQIQQADDIQKKIVDLPEWDKGEDKCRIEVRSMTGEERAELLQECMKQDPKRPNDPKAKIFDMKAAYPRVLIGCSFNPETGEKVFRPEDREWLMKKCSAPLERLSGVAMKLSGLSEEAEEEAGKESPEGIQN